MENWGLITFRETSVLYDPDFSSISNHLAVTLTVTHELAHMWFGDLGKCPNAPLHIPHQLLINVNYSYASNKLFFVTLKKGTKMA